MSRKSRFYIFSKGTPDATKNPTFLYTNLSFVLWKMPTINRKIIYLENIFILCTKGLIFILYKRDLYIVKKTEKKLMKNDQRLWVNSLQSKIPKVKKIYERMFKFTSSLENGNYNKEIYYFIPHWSGRNK